MNEQNRTRYRQALKHPDVEEHIDLWFYRPMGFRLALLGERLGITPNIISVISIFLGVGCGLLCYPTDWRLNLLGMLLLVLADICDSADGQLARLTRQYSRLGRILDGACGDVWFVTIYVCICLRLTPTIGWYVWVLAMIAGYCHRMQASLADYYRNFHLFFVKGEAGSELDDSARIVDEYSAIEFRKEPLYKTFMWFYKTYTKAQEAQVRQMTRFRTLLRLRYPTEMPQELRESFRQKSLPLMKYCNALTFNWRAITLFVSLMAGMPWLYFMTEILIGQTLYFYMHRKHEAICTSFADRLEKTEA